MSLESQSLAVNIGCIVFGALLGSGLTHAFLSLRHATLRLELIELLRVAYSLRAEPLASAEETARRNLVSAETEAALGVGGDGPSKKKSATRK